MSTGPFSIRFATESFIDLAHEARLSPPIEVMIKLAEFTALDTDSISVV